MFHFGFGVLRAGKVVLRQTTNADASSAAAQTQVAESATEHWKTQARKWERGVVSCRGRCA